MFFILSKTLGIAILPMNFLIGVGLLGAILLATRYASLGRKLLVGSIVLIAVCGFSPLGNWLLYPLETRFPPWDPAQGTPDGVVVLGGAIDPEISAGHGVAVFQAAPDRVIAAAAIARQYPNVRIVFSGGSSNLISGDAREADYAAALFESLGVSPQRLTMQRRSRNTGEDAEFSKAAAAPKDGERWLLMTSAYHLPRAVGIFRKAGFQVVPYPAGWLVGGAGDLTRFRSISTGGLYRVNIAVREWIGLAAYWISGKTDEFFPGPG